MSETVLMPRALTAENGAKGLLSGQFYEHDRIQCCECAGDGGDCPVCMDGTVLMTVPASWTTIKKIYAMAVKELGK